MTNNNCGASVDKVADWLRTKYDLGKLAKLQEMVGNLSKREAAAERLHQAHYGTEYPFTDWVDEIIKIEGCEQPCTPVRAIRIVLRKLHDDNEMPNAGEHTRHDQRDQELLRQIRVA